MERVPVLKRSPLCFRDTCTSHCSRAVRARPGGAERFAWVALGKGFEMSGKRKDAEAAYQRAIQDSRTDDVRSQAQDNLRQLEVRRG